MPPVLFPVLLITHVALALALFLPSFLLPFAFRSQRGSLKPEASGRFVRFLLTLQSRGTLWIGVGLALTGLGLLASVGFRMLEQPRSWRPFGRNSTSTWCGEFATPPHISR